VRLNGQGAGETDEAGRFTLQGLCPGKATLEVERIDCIPARRTITIQGYTSIEVELTLAGTELVEITDKAPPPPSMRAATLLSGAALERKRGRGFSDTLAEVPGVSQLRSATGVAKPIIRGQFGRRLLLLVDSVRHRAQEWGLEHAPEIDPFIADRITVVRGAGGVRYGPDAIGGAVLVEPPDLRREPGYAGEAHVIGTSNGWGGTAAGRLLGATSAASRVRGLAWQLEGSAKRLAAARAPDYALDNTGALEWNAGVTAGYTRGAGEHRLSYRHYQARLGVCTCLRLANADEFFAQLDRGRPIDADLYSAELGIDRPYQTVAHDLALARSRWDWRGVGMVTGTYSFQHDLRREYDVVRQATTGAQFNFRLVTHELELLLEHNPIHLDEHWHLRGAAGLVGVGQIHDYAGLPLVPGYRSAGGAVYLAERLVGHDLEVEAGLRYDFVARTAEIAREDFLRLVRSGQLAEDACGAGSPDPVACASRYHTLTASLGALRRFGKALSAKLELSTASRAPNPDEQYLNGTAPTFPVLGLGKPDLAPETTYSTSATVTYQHPRVTAEASAYGNLIADYIYFAPALDENGNAIFDVLVRGAFPRFTTRPVDALFYGADGGIAVTPHPRVELGGQVSIVRAKNVRDDSYLVFVPADRFRGAVTLHAPDGWGLRKTFLSVAGTYVARQRRYDLMADFAAPPAAYVQLGAELGTETTAAGQTLRFALQGQNLTNARYRDYTSLLRYFADEPGLQVWLRASVFFDSKSPPRTKGM
jgi:iron complex outermembrane receptor protein